jgi:hypothetical protein
MECCAGGEVVTVALKSVIRIRCTVAEDTRKKFHLRPSSQVSQFDRRTSRSKTGYITPRGLENQTNDPLKLWRVVSDHIAWRYGHGLKPSLSIKRLCVRRPVADVKAYGGNG